MLRIPAMDLIDGKVVRLTKGDYAMKTTYEKEPVKWARSLEKAGAQRLHVVDLDGAKAGRPLHQGLIMQIRKAIDIPLQVGGGIRDIEAARRYLEAGIDYVIIGSMAFKDPASLNWLISKYGERIIVSLDVKNGFLATGGWLESESSNINGVLKDMEKQGVRTIIYTDIGADGTLGGIDEKLYKNIAPMTTMNLIAAGGVSQLADIHTLEKIGLYGAIIGKALYEGRLALKELFI